MTPTGRAWLLAWGGVAAVAVANGGFRERVLVPRCGPERAHLVSTAMLVSAIAGGAAALGRARPLPDRRAAVRVGLGWAAGTVAFELAVGAVRRVPLSTLVADYDLRAGRVWALVPLTMAVAPVVAERLNRSVTREAVPGPRRRRRPARRPAPAAARRP